MCGVRDVGAMKVLIHQLIIPPCAGCNRIRGDTCVAYAVPEAKHRPLGGCPLRSNRVYEAVTVKKKNPIKASKKKGG